MSKVPTVHPSFFTDWVPGSNLTRADIWHRNSMICDFIRAGTATQGDWQFLRRHAHPTLFREMVKEACFPHQKGRAEKLANAVNSGKQWLTGGDPADDGGA